MEDEGKAWEDGYANDGAGSYILYSHMVAQRRKMMRGKGKERTRIPT